MARNDERRKLFLPRANSKEIRERERNCCVCFRTELSDNEARGKRKKKKQERKTIEKKKREREEKGE